MADNDVVIQADIREAVTVLTMLGGSKNKMLKSVLGSVGTKAKSVVKKNYKYVLKKQTGDLYSSIRRKVNRKGDTVVVTAHKKGDINRYGFVLAHGATILPKNGKSLLLRDKLTGAVLAKKSVIVIPPKDFVVGPVKDYLRTGQFKNDLMKITEKQLEKIVKAAKKK